MGAIVNQTVRIGEKEYQDAIISSPGVDIKYDIKGIFNSFSAMAGIGDNSFSNNGVEFIVMGDDKEIWRSESLKNTDGLKNVKVDITGVQILVLRINSGGGETATVPGTPYGEQPRRGRGQRNRVQAAWIDATLVLN